MKFGGICLGGRQKGCNDEGKEEEIEEGNKGIRNRSGL
ncbi:hypothetical protein BVRB_6g140540 [Beta vulgaris subsp. vulgaris]|nr:hypothetical protein BVRB_6g140540 [Beta vulgaris subsp. vulgaris]